MKIFLRSSMQVNGMRNIRFPFTLAIARLVSIFGAILIALGIFVGGEMGYEYIQSQSIAGAKWEWTPQDLITLGVASLLVLHGIVLVMVAGAIKFLSAIEQNTRLPQETNK